MCRSFYFGLLLAFHIVGPGIGEYLITIDPTRIEIGITETLSMKCSYRGAHSTNDLSTITRVRILKEEAPDDFEIIAEARDSDPQITNVGLGPSANVTGLVSSNAQSSYLLIVWSEVTAGILGRYRCDVVGFRANQDVAVVKSPVFVVREINITIMDVVDLANRFKLELEQELQTQQDYCNSQIGGVEGDAEKLIAGFKVGQDNAIKVIESDLLAKMSVVAANVDRLMETGVLQYWPQGTYGLLMPDTDCPNNAGAVWRSGYVIFHTESTDRNYDEISVPSHLKLPVLERINTDNFVLQQFCISSSLSPGADWPQGSYCINRVGGLCPNGFSSGSVTWQDEITESKANVSGAVPDGIYWTNTSTIYYCCRSDGQPDEPIYLPRARPFYLYRYNGTCQEVVGMQTTPEYLVYDTDNSNQDSYEDIYHPDGSINNVLIEFCYYSELRNGHH